MHPQRTLIEAAEQVVLNEELISYHPDGKGHETKGSVGADTIPAKIISQLPKEYHGHKSVSPNMHGTEGTVTVSYMQKWMGENRKFHTVIAPPDIAKAHHDRMSAYHDDVMKTRMRTRLGGYS